jgi:hypothetical protein
MSVMHASSGAPVASGDTVYVRYGLDTLEGVVVERYGTGPSARVVVRLTASEGSNGEPAIPESDVYRADQVSETEPPGTWVNEAHFEHMLDQALRNALERLRASAALEREKRDQPDFMIHTSEGDVVVEAKFTRRSALAPITANKIASWLEAQYPYAGKLLISNASFAKTVYDALLAHDVCPVTWRSEQDDSALVSALKAALRRAHKPEEKNEPRQS